MDRRKRGCNFANTGRLEKCGNDRDLVARLVGWLVGWLGGWVGGWAGGSWVVGWLVGCLVAWLLGCLVAGGKMQKFTANIRKPVSLPLRGEYEKQSFPFFVAAEMPLRPPLLPGASQAMSRARRRWWKISWEKTNEGRNPASYNKMVVQIGRPGMLNGKNGSFRGFKSNNITT